MAKATHGKQKAKTGVEKKTLGQAYRLMCTARHMAILYDNHKEVCARYVHSTSRGHEAIQLATGLQLKPFDFASLYYRDESVLLGMGLRPYELMLQLMAKRDDPFSGGRTYYGHPALRRKGFPTIPHQSSATGMQAIPATGMAHGLAYLESQGLLKGKNKPVVLCSLGDGSVTEGEVSEAFQMAVLKKLPILYLVQDNGWGISATAGEMRAMDAYEYAAGFKGLERMRVDGAGFEESFAAMQKAIAYVRKNRAPILVHARCPLLGHHTSGVRKEWYRGDDLAKQEKQDPLPRFEKYLLGMGFSKRELDALKQKAAALVDADYQQAVAAPGPAPEGFASHEFAPTPVLEEKGNRAPKGGDKVVMVDAALHAVDEILKKHPEALLYGQDVGGRLGGVFREAATLAQKYGDQRVFNTPIQEAYIVGSTAGMSAVGATPIVEIQFADYIWPGINQLVEELSKSCYLTQGKFPIQSLIRVPVGAYGGGGPYHSGSVESALLTIRGIKVVYPSNAADMKGLLKASFYDPNPVVLLEHKGLYWSKVPGTLDAKTVEPDEAYIIPLGKANRVQLADREKVGQGISAVVVTYGMGVYWAKEASAPFEGQVEILDLRTLNPVDWEAIVASVKMHGKVLVLTEEPLMNSFAESLAGRISRECFAYLDAPVWTVGAANLPAVPLNVELEKMMLPNADKVKVELKQLLEY
ncbi:MAG: thiamine pyrophosphate-dependent enzyme [Cyclobacteriaceae bacterium]|nr:tungsten formylmethanofuran dehydrogenase [Cyclobacteriaceae bacterium]MCB0500779.1 tungsten formylmethanofuran dehydrogenase [Cyclobacteriaceae bacterium]MCB9236686.1 tungsten formylmethanofuran dehydrogenase [Flammeovirgaceae bacterium]MCO5272607.1 thiamine pyrophosphate-dependent enzyme [Cyclobacteriaceae bacterium]MCW5901965.1 tungsten formylmethanofuran dehydrogenase [Cyclobacteriaceae bacterium]